MTDNLRVMPKMVDLGQQLSTTMASPISQWEHWIKDGRPNPHGLRTVMGYFLPSWQRELVWTEAQKVAFIESAWRGIPLGTFTYNVLYDRSPLDDILIDGQQRMNAIECYLTDQFPVFGYKWSEVTVVDRRVFDTQVGFASYRCQSKNEAYLRSYYNLMNFGGVAHKESERA
jgi:hypothetical protein